MFFIPTVNVVQEADSLTMIARLLVPNGCYSEAGTKEGWPESAGIPETLPIQLLIDQADGPCTRAVKPLAFHRDVTKEAEGKSTLTAFSMLDGKVVGAGSVPLDALQRSVSALGLTPLPGPLPAIEPGTLIAVANLMPPGPGSFYVMCDVITPTPGWTLALKPAEPQGINPKILILDLIAEPPGGAVPRVITTTTVRYDIRPYEPVYEAVTVRNGDQVLSAPVQTVV